MKRVFASLVVCAAVNVMTATSAFAADHITGAGATFPYPVYSKWAQTYQKENGTQLNYQAIGSGGGIKLEHLSHARIVPRRRQGCQHHQYHRRCP